MKYFAVLLGLLRDRDAFLNDIQNEVRLERKIIALLVSSCIFFAVYGAIIGSSSSWLQLIASAIKLPALYLITLVICLPTLYFFDILFGSKLSFGQYITLMLTNMAVISVLLFSFAPVTLFFLISVPDYDFFLLLNVAFFGVTGFVGVKLFYEGMLSLTVPQTLPSTVEQAIAPLPASQSTSSEDRHDFTDEIIAVEDNQDSRIKTKETSANKLQDSRRKLLQAWLILYGLVGSQLGWTLRPFFGAPGEPFQLFRPDIGGNFYINVIQTLLHFLFNY